MSGGGSGSGSSREWMKGCRIEVTDGVRRALKEYVGLERQRGEDGDDDDDGDEKVAIADAQAAIDNDGCVGGASVPARLLRRACFAVRKHSERKSDSVKSQMYMHVVARGAKVTVPLLDAGMSQTQLAAAESRQSSSTTTTVEVSQLKAKARHMQELRRMVDQRAYDAMVEDVDAGVRRTNSEGAALYRHSIGFGANLVAVLFTLSVFGGVAGPHICPSVMTRDAARGAGAVIGLVCGLILETVLFIVRAVKDETETDDDGAVILASSKGRRNENKMKTN